MQKPQHAQAHLSPADILQGLKNKSPEVFRYLYHHYGDMIAKYVRKNSGNEEDVRDMIQIVMTEFWNAVREGRYEEQGKMEQYLYRLTYQNWQYELRRRRNRPASLLDELPIQIRDQGEEHLTAILVKDRQLNAIHQALEHMENPCKEIIQLFHLAEVSLQKVAEKMQYDYNNLRKRIFDCRKKLKRLAEEILSNHNEY